MAIRAIVLFAVVSIAASAAQPARAQNTPNVDGTWKLSIVTGGTSEQSLAIITLQSADGKISGEPVASVLGKTTVKSAAVAGPLLRLTLQAGIELSFEGALPKEKGKQILGSVDINGTIYPAMLTATEETELTQKNAFRSIPCPPLQQARNLANKAAKLKQGVLTAKDPDKKADLLKQYDEAETKVKEETPKLYRELLEKHGDSPAVFEAIALIRSAGKYDAKAFDVTALAKSLADAAKPYGPRWHEEIVGQLASALVNSDGHAALALQYAKEAEAGLSDKSPAAAQIRTLNVVAKALRKNGKAEDAAKLDERVEKLEVVLDREYHAKMPGFKGEPFAGRKGKSERVAFMELFTGAMCPPCVAADLAFDVLQKTYKPSELVLVQYHMHIPGPDPLTNPNTEARWAYYRSAYPGKVGGVPTALFNGQPKAGGGGPLAFAEKKYHAYREVIDALLEEETSIKLAAKAERHGDKIDINVRVSGLADPGKDKKLRILLAEESIRYLGSNKIRFHHNVVRACPGGVEGTSLTEPASRHNASISIADLRGNLTKYLDDFEANNRPFANPSRPLAMSQLRVIAFVQDDMTHEILQTVQVEVEGK